MSYVCLMNGCSAWEDAIQPFFRMKIFCYIALREESVDEVCTQKSFCIREWEIHGIELSGILLSV